MKKLIVFLLASLLWSEAWGQTVVVKRWPDSLSTNGKFVAITDLLIAQNGNVFAAAFGTWSGIHGSIYRTTDDGLNWVNLYNNGQNGLTSSEGFGVFQDPATGALLLGTWNGIFRSTDNGETWSRPTLPPPSDIYPIRRFAIDSQGKIFAGSSKGSGINLRPVIVISNDSGLSWSYVIIDSTRASDVMEICIAPNGAIFAASSDYGVYRSLDSGRTWQQANSGLPTWTINGIPTSIIYLRSIACDENGVVYAGTGGVGLYKSTDNGENWKYVRFYNNSVDDILIVRPNLIFIANMPAGGPAGIFRYDGREWERIGPPPSACEGGMSLARKDNNLFIGTSNGVYLAFDIINNVEVPSSVPTEFYLAQNYPNPFNSSTTIEFTLPERSFVKLTITNILGQEIEVLVAEVKEVGSHRFVWDARDLPSGIYLYRLETNFGFRATRKMLLVK